MLIQGGGKIELLNGMRIPAPNVLRRLLQLQPEAVKKVFDSDSIVEKTVIERDEILSIVRVMREFDFPPPDPHVLANLRKALSNHAYLGELDFALFTFQYSKERPKQVPRELFWRPHTHFACCENTRQQVVAALGVMRRVCPRVLRDLRHVILVMAFGQETVAADEKYQKMSL